MQAEAWRTQRWPAIIRDRTAHRQTIPPDRRRLGIGPPFQRPFKWAHTAHLFLQLLLGVPIGLEDRLGRFAQVVKLAELVWNTGKHRCHRRPNRLLPVGDDATDRHRQRLLDFPQQRDQVPLGRAQETAREQHLPGEAVADHPEHFVAAVGLEAIERQDHLALRAEERPEPLVIGQAERDQFLIAVDEVGDSALRQGNAAGEQALVDFGHAAMLSIAQPADERDDIEAEFAMWERPGTFFLRAIGLMKAGAGGGDAAADVERQAVDPRQGGNGALRIVDGPKRSLALGAASTHRLEQLLMSRGRATSAARHTTPPTIYKWIIRRSEREYSAIQ